MPERINDNQKELVTINRNGVVLKESMVDPTTTSLIGWATKPHVLQAVWRGQIKHIGLPQSLPFHWTGTQTKNNTSYCNESGHKHGILINSKYTLVT